MDEKLDVGYSPESLNRLCGDELYKIVTDLHCALFGLLWQIDDLRMFHELILESHFNDTVPVHRAYELHRLLCDYAPRHLIELLDSERDQFEQWWGRCAVGESFSSTREEP